MNIGTIKIRDKVSTFGTLVFTELSSKTSKAPDIYKYKFNNTKIAVYLQIKTNYTLCYYSEFINISENKSYS